MAVETTMMGLFLLLAATLVVLFISSKIHLPTIIGFFVTGILIGPSCLHLFTYDQVSLVAEFGLILLMFTIGLEISLKNLLAMKRLVLIAGGVQILLTTFVVWLILNAAGIPSGTALLLGFMVASSSTAIVLNLYQNNGQIDTRHGKLILAILICQDIAVIPIMLLLPVIAGVGGNVVSSLMTLGTDIIALVVVLGIALVVVPRILDVVAARRNRELFIISVVTICIGVAWILSLAGVSTSLGAFLAGVAIAGSEYNHEVLGIIMPIRDLMTSVFFISVGMMLSVAFMLDHILFILALVAVLFLGKMVITTAAGLLSGAAAGAAVIGGVGLAHIGEFSFVLGAAGMSLGLLNDTIYQVFLAVAILSMTIAPFAVDAAPKVSRMVICSPLVSRRCSPGTGEQETAGETETEDDHEYVIVVGFGPAGKYVVRALKRVGREYIILEMNPETVAAERAKGENIAYGDASLEPILRYAGIERAKTLVITIPDSAAVRGIVSAARRMNPRTTIITRTRYTGESPTLFKIGVDEVIADEREAGLAMTRRVFASESVPAKDLDQYVREVRAEIFSEREEAMAQKAEESRLRRLSATLEPAVKTEFVHVPVHPESESAGKVLSDLHLRKRFHVSIVSLRRESGEVILTPDGTTILLPHDMVLLSGSREDVSAVQRLFGKKQE
ncbi:MAG TPA: cation:proton antiporter [Methanocorpusculum sp.]|nr:cation:proton antiporter [Methanocorpusculum sp.]HJK80713.1 cation:proton antiporter [Methanocorpusculum sp.]